MNRHSSNKVAEEPHQNPDVSGLDHGWAWVVMIASFGAFLIIGGSVYSVGIIHIALLERYGQDITKTSWVGALHSSMINIGGMNFCLKVHNTNSRPNNNYYYGNFNSR